MACPNRAQIKKQTRAATPDPWFTLHILVCEDCRGEYEFLHMLQEVHDGIKAEDENQSWEPLDPLARAWMLEWGFGGSSPYPGTSH